MLSTDLCVRIHALACKHPKIASRAIILTMVSYHLTNFWCPRCHACDALSRALNTQACAQSHVLQCALYIQACTYRLVHTGLYLDSHIICRIHTSMSLNPCVQCRTHASMCLDLQVICRANTSVHSQHCIMCNAQSQYSKHNLLEDTGT